MDYRCGQCRQFTREKRSLLDMCGAWGQPTDAKRAACDYFMPTISGKARVAPQNKPQND